MCIRDRVFTLDEIDQAFTELTPQFEVRARRSRTDEDANLHAMVRCIGDLNDADASVPARRGFAQPPGLTPNDLDGKREVHPEEHRAENVGAGSRPVLKRVLDEPGERDDEAALV